MSAHSPQSTPLSDSRPTGAPRQKSRNWGALALLGIIALGICVVAVLLLAAIVPVQWAQYVGQLIHGRLAVSTWYGLLAGLVLTWLSLTVLWQARRRMRWGWRAVIAALATLIALPNLLTAAVAFGTSDSVHAAQRILEADATFFAASTGYGAAAGAVLFLIGAVMSMAFRRRGRKLKALKTEQQALRANSAGLQAAAAPAADARGSRAAGQAAGLRGAENSPSAQPVAEQAPESEEEFSWMKEK